MEKLQNKGIRLAMGYRSSTPLNVMTAEAKITKIEDRAGLLAKNYWTKIAGYNEKKTEAKMNRMEILNRRKGKAIPKRSSFMLMESWRSFKINKQLEKKSQPGVYIYRINYWINTNRITTDIEIGKERQEKKKIKDEELIKKFKEN